MTHLVSRRRVVAAVAGLPLVGLSLAHRVEAGHKPDHPVQPTPTPVPPDFSISAWLDPTYDFPGNLVRGGPEGPLYKMFSYSGCFWVSNVIHVRAIDGFTGTVALEILNLPAGVTSQTATSVTLTETETFVRVELDLIAASDAPLGTATVSVRGTSGALVHTADFKEFSVVDVLPPCEF